MWVNNKVTGCKWESYMHFIIFIGITWIKLIQCRLRYSPSGMMKPSVAWPSENVRKTQCGVTTIRNVSESILNLRRNFDLPLALERVEKVGNSTSRHFFKPKIIVGLLAAILIQVRSSELHPKSALKLTRDFCLKSRLTFFEHTNLRSELCLKTLLRLKSRLSSFEHTALKLPLALYRFVSRRTVCIDIRIPRPAQDCRHHATTMACTERPNHSITTTRSWTPKHPRLQHPFVTTQAERPDNSNTTVTTAIIVTSVRPQANVRTMHPLQPKTDVLIVTIRFKRFNLAPRPKS